MVQLNNLKEIQAKDIPDLLNTITPILEKRNNLYNAYYRRGANQSTLFSEDDETIKVAFETYIADMSSGYFGGKEPKYLVNTTSDKEKQGLITKIFSKLFTNKSYTKEMEILIKYITDFNDDSTEHLELVRDYLIKTACYELIYENDKNEIVYTKLDPLQTVAIWDYSTPINLIGLVRTWQELDSKGKPITIVEITDINGTRYYEGSKSYQVLPERFKKNNWKDVPAFAIEQPDGLAIFETVISLIDAYQRVIQNARNTFEYNDNAKLKVTGYTPQEPLTTVDDDGETIANPDRTLEDKLLLESKVFYTPDASGDIEWITKDIQDNAENNHKKTLVDLIAMLSGVPNITDLGFTSADNASAIDRKFFALEQKISLADKLFKKAYLRRWELVFDRINLKKNTDYDFRDIQVKLYRNLPTDKYTETDSALKLRGLVSDETVINMLPYELDAQVEMSKKDNETEDSIIKNEMSGLNEREDIENEMEGNRPTSNETLQQVS
jgi:SPP1 family phage portal protein